MEAYEVEQKINELQSQQDGSHGMNLCAKFIGGKYNGWVVNHEVLKAMGNGKFSTRWSQVNPDSQFINLKLEDQPLVDGYLSPMLDGDLLRYETQEVYDMMFD